MVRVRKSPNMISTTGRKPAMAAPTPIPVNPASEIGVSTTRSAPNSSTSPESTLKGVPASATSSPKMQTFESRRISSASASRTACANVSSRSGIDVLLHLIHTGIRRSNRKFHRGFHLGARFRGDVLECRRLGVALLDDPLRVQFDGIALHLPMRFFLLRAIVFAIDIADVVPAVSVSVSLQKSRSFAGASALHQSRRNLVHCAHILSVDRRRLDAERSRATKNRTGRCLAE